MDRVARQAGASPARKRKREREGRCEGPKPLSETRPEVVALARKLRRRRPKGGQLSLREVAKELAARGFLNERGKPYAAKSVASMLRSAAARRGVRWSSVAFRREVTGHGSHQTTPGVAKSKGG
jgi:hypothetical protein